MRYLVTGATGFVGKALARHLREAGHEVLALVRTPTKAGSLTVLGVEVTAGDIGDPASVRAALRGVDGLFHVAGWYKVGSRDVDEARRVNVEGTRTVLTAAGEAGTARVVYTSTLAVNSDTHGRVVDESYRFTGTHLSVYDQTKAEAHHVARELAGAGVPVRTVLPGLVYGPGDTSQTGAMLRAVLDGKRPAVSAGLTVCWGHVDDIAAGHVAAMKRGTDGADYMLAGPVASVADGLALAASIAGRPGPRVFPAGVVGGSARVLGLLGRVLPPAAGGAESLRVSGATYLGSAAKAQRELGWSARALRPGLAETIRLSRITDSWPLPPR